MAYGRLIEDQMNYCGTELCLLKINLEKVHERWWEAVLVDEPKISVRKIDASRPMTDLDDEAQAKIEELMYNEQQKRLGLPQSHEQVSLAPCNCRIMVNTVLFCLYSVSHCLASMLILLTLLLHSF